MVILSQFKQKFRTMRTHDPKISKLTKLGCVVALYGDFVKLVSIGKIKMKFRLDVGLVPNPRP